MSSSYYHYMTISLIIIADVILSVWCTWTLPLIIDQFMAGAYPGDYYKMDKWEWLFSYLLGWLSQTLDVHQFIKYYIIYRYILGTDMKMILLFFYVDCILLLIVFFFFNMFFFWHWNIIHIFTINLCSWQSYFKVFPFWFMFFFQSIVFYGFVYICSPLWSPDSFVWPFTVRFL